MKTTWWALAAVVFGLGGAAGCTSTHKASAPSVPSTTGPASAATSSTVAAPTTATTSAPTPTTPPSTTASAGPQPCQTAALAASLGSPNAAAGTAYYPLVFRNTGSASCTLYGYPGVSFVTGQSGQQVGAPADHRPGTVTTLTLASGQSAQADLAIADAGNYPASCQLTPVVGLRVYPPNQTQSLFVPHPDHACANPQDGTLHVGPMAAA
jgi:hypothetical protein